jgi:hypothetical protein
MRVEYGPPGVKGVTTILGLGAADAEEAYYADQLATITRQGAAALGAVTILSWLFGAKTIARTAGASAATLVAVMYLARRKTARPSLTAPTSQ